MAYLFNNQDENENPSSSHSEPQMTVVQNEPQACPYLPNQTARMPMYLPAAPLAGTQLDRLLDQGYRRSGLLFYRTMCPSCVACEPTRIDLSRYRFRRSDRRVLNRGNRILTTVIAPPSMNSTRVSLFNQHRIQRQLCEPGQRLDAAEYQCFLVDTSCETVEFSFWDQETLLAVATMDRGEDCVSAVYTYFDPSQLGLSLGTYAILKQLEYSQQQGKRWFYLGFYVQSNRHLNYKGRFTPQERRVENTWKVFDRPCEKTSLE